MREDIVGTEDGLARYPYIRESRRIRSEFIVLEHHVGTEMRMKRTGKSQSEGLAESFKDLSWSGREFTLSSWLFLPWEWSWFLDWDFTGIQTAMPVDGTLNNKSDHDRG